MRRPAALRKAILAATVTLVAIASPVGASPNLGKWAPVPASLPPGSWANANFVHIACTSATNCFASGEVANAIDAARGVWTSGVIERWNGSRFSVVPVALAHTGLGAITCVSAKSCWVVGTKYGKVGTATATVILHWNGSAWSTVKSPSPVNGSSFGGIACASSTKCFAVGASYSGSSSRPMLEQWNGSSWTLGTLPSPAKQLSAMLWQISCPSPSICVAIGSEQSSASTAAHGFSEVWKGNVWSIDPMPAPSSLPATSLNQIDCLSNTDCLSVGSTSTFSNGVYGPSHAYAAQWDGHLWRMISLSSSVQRGVSIFGDMACASPITCWAVGESPSGHPAAAELNGSSFILGTVGGTGTVLDADGCWAGVYCIGIGMGQANGSAATAIADRIPF